MKKSIAMFLWVLAIMGLITSLLLFSTKKDVPIINVNREQSTVWLLSSVENDDRTGRLERMYRVQKEAQLDLVFQAIEALNTLEPVPEKLAKDPAYMLLTGEWRPYSVLVVVSGESVYYISLTRSDKYQSFSNYTQITLWKDFENGAPKWYCMFDIQDQPQVQSALDNLYSVYQAQFVK